MPKVILTDIVAGYQLKEAYNANNDALTAAIENTLSRDGTTPNQMEAQLDMNSNKVTNVANGTASGDAVNYSQIQALAVGAGIDHGALDGLADDDHTQYHTNARGDARYSLLAHDHAGVYEPEFSKNTAFNKDFGTLVDTVCQGNDARLSDARTPTAHTHVEADITDLQTYALDSVVVKTTGDQTIDGVKTFTDVGFFESTLHVGAQGMESDSIRIDNAERTVRIKASSLGTGNPASVLAHQHSTSAAPEYLFARSNSAGAVHGAVTNGMKLGSNIALGWAHATPGYLPAAEIRYEVDATGTVGADSMPGRIVFATTKDGEKAPTAALTIDRSQIADFLFPPTAGGVAMSLVGHTHLWDDLTDKPATFAPSAHGHPWSEITSQPTTLSGTVNLAGTQTITGQKVFEYAAGNTLVTIQKNAAGNQAVLDFRDEAGVQRNIFGLAGGAADDFFIGRYNDAGVWQGSTMYVPAATGIANFQFTPTAGGVGMSLVGHTHVRANITDFAHTHPIADVTGRAILTRGTGLTGNNYDVGTATTWAVAYGTAAGTACVGNDARLSDARTPLAHTHVKDDITDFAHTHVEADITDLQAYALDNVVVKLTGNQTVAGVKTFSSAPRTHRAAADMVELWRTDASADDGRWVFQVGANGEFDLLGLTDAGAAGQVAMRIARSGAALVPAVNLYANNLVTLATQQHNTGDATTGAVVRHRNGSFYDVGMNVTPITNIDGADLTLSSSRVGGLIRKWDTVARNLNIPASTDVDIPIGAWFEYHGWNPGVVTLVGGTGVTINWLTGSAVETGNRSFARGSSVKIWRVDAARWHVSGIGIS